VRTRKTSEADALLNVSPNTLRAWERRFGYPKPQRSAARHRLSTHGEVAALRDALQQGLPISSAVSRAREELFCGRAGARVMALPVGCVAGLGDVVASLSPDAVVIAGSHACDDDVARWASRVRAATGQLPTALFRRTQSAATVRNAAGARVLPDTPFGAQRQLLAFVGRDEIVAESAPPLRAANALPRRGART
jgi:hypothetical protein